MTDQRLSERLRSVLDGTTIVAAVADHGLGKSAWSDLATSVQAALPALQALEAREERLTAALETVVVQLDRVPRSTGPALLVAQRALAESRQETTR